MDITQMMPLKRFIYQGKQTQKIALTMEMEEKMNENIVTILFMHFIFSLIYSWCDAFDAMMHTKQPPDQLELYINDEHKSYYYYYNAIWLLRWCCCAVLFFSHDWCSRFHASFVTNVWVFVSPSSCFLPDRQNENIFFLKKCL